MRDDDTLTKLVNQSGFPLQLAIEQMVAGRSKELGWNVLYREHGWSGRDGSRGFIDLVLVDQHDTSILVLECKRVQDSEWLFLDGNEKKSTSRRVRLWITNTPDNGNEHFGYFDALCLPESPESGFCVVPGQAPKDRPMLERVAAELVSATEALAAEESPILSRRGLSLRMYAKVIVTTARLVMSRFDPRLVDLAVGEAADVEHVEIPWVRFSKQLSWEPAIQLANAEQSFAAIAAAKEKSVFVVNAGHLPEFLARWDVDNGSLRALSQRRVR
jgi:hypothetical protein